MYRVCVDLSNKKFSSLTVIKRVGRDEKNNAVWLCKCDCGKEVNVISANLNRGNTKSCGCLQISMISKLSRTHGYSVINSRAYNTWRNIKSRCYKKDNRMYGRYGSRGIQVCERWRSSFLNFLEDMGEPKDGYSIERIDNNGNYEPSNCKWATIEEQSRNKSNNKKFGYNGRVMVLADWAREWGVRQSSISQMMNKGKPFNQVYEFYTKKRNRVNKTKANEV